MDKNNSRDKAETANVRLIESFYESLGRGDVPAVLGLLAPDVKWTEAERFPYYTGTWTGPQAVLDNLLKRLIVDLGSILGQSEDRQGDGGILCPSLGGS